MRRLRFALVLALPVAAAWADVVPPRPRPPPPSGPPQAIIRGVEIRQDYGYWHGRRWLTYVVSCPPAQPSCHRLDPAARCIVTGIAGHSIEPGRIDLLLAAERGATGKPLALSLEGCAGLAELELLP